MKILLATFWFSPHIGGVDTHLKVLKKGFEERGHQVDILAHHPDMDKIYRLSDEHYIEKKPILYPVHEIMMDYYDQELSELENWARYRDIERYVYEMASSLIGLDQYDVIHTHDVISARAFSRVKLARTPHVATIHGLLMDEFLETKEIKTTGSSNWKYSFVEEYMGATSADVTILPSEWLRREYINRFFVASEKLTVIPYGLDLTSIVHDIEMIPHEIRSDEKIVMICPARLVPYKGQRFLVEALGKLLQERDDFICLFAGVGPSEAELISMAEQLHLQEHVRFLGKRSDMFRMYKQADIFVLPSLVENHSVAIMEAQIVGLPVITTRVGGNAELIVPGHTGLLVEPRSSDELHKALLNLMKDSLHRNRLAETSRHWARKYWQSQNMLDRTLQVYEAAMGMKR